MAILLSVVPAFASHLEASLAGSNFEIDDNANLKLDDAAPSIDWGSLAHPNGPELRSTDLATGQNDNSYKGGVKEDTECPGEVTGSIPNNKSDLLTFHVYEEAGVGAHRYDPDGLRVQPVHHGLPRWSQCGADRR
jgi:hypothetical protein